MSCVTVSTVRPVRARTASSRRRNARIRCGVLTGRRLVEHQHAGRADKQRAEGKPLPAALAQLPRARLLQPAEAEEVDRLLDSQHRVGRQRAELAAEFQLADHRLLEQHLVGRLQQQRDVRGVLEDLPGPDRVPRKDTTPALGLPIPTVRAVSVLLPEPLAPIMATHSPSSTARLTSSTARLAPKSTVT